MENPFYLIEKEGQSIWFDNISRSLLDTGTLKRMVDEDHLKGVTSNPTIFDRSISGSKDYDPDIFTALEKGVANPEDIFYEIATVDIRDAADTLYGVYKKSEARDGYVSIEVSPDLAYDTDKTIANARELFQKVNRPNVMIKVPSTREGIAAIETLIAAGININVTLIFSVERYIEVARAYIRGIETRISRGEDVTRVASVASFFVSRIDTAVDRRLHAVIESDAKRKEEAVALLGKTAVANARVAYQEFTKIFHSESFHACCEKGAQVQRVLWASTSSKNPEYDDLLYIHELVGPETVNTVPPATYEKIRKHDQIEAKLEKGTLEARHIFSSLGKLGISLAEVTQELEDAGVKSFSDSYHSLLHTIEEKSERIKS